MVTIVVGMIRSENILTHAFLSHFQNESYNNCLLESSHLENPSVLTGWRSGTGMDNWGCITIMPEFWQICWAQSCKTAYTSCTPSSKSAPNTTAPKGGFLSPQSTGLKALGRGSEAIHP